MKYKIKTINHDGTIIEVEVSVNVYNFDKENNWQEDWRTRKSNREDSYEEVLKIYEKNGLPSELQEVSSETKYIRGYEYEQLKKAINKLPKVKRRRLMLRYFYNLSIQQISSAEKVSKKVIERSLRKAEENLKKIVERFFDLSNEKCILGGTFLAFSTPYI